jgi:hypothetical protein
VDRAPGGGALAPGACLRGVRRSGRDTARRGARRHARDGPPRSFCVVGLERLARARGAPARERAGGPRARASGAGARGDGLRDGRPRDGEPRARARARAGCPLRGPQPRGDVDRLRGERARRKGRGRARARPPRRGHGRSGGGRAASPRDGHGLLRHDPLLPGARRLRPRRGMDGGGEPLVRPPRHHRLPGRLPHPPGGAPAPPRRVAGGGGAGRSGLRGAQRLQPLDHGGRVLRDRRDPAAARRLRRRRGRLQEGERAGP